MKTPLKLLVTLVLFTSIFAPTALAQTYGVKEKSLVLGSDRVVNENYFGTAESVTIEGTINGDAYLAGGTILINGTINGDLFVAGGTVTINGTIAEDLRAASGDLNVMGEIRGGVTAAGGTVTFGKDSQIGEGLVAGSGNLEIYAPIGGGITVGAGNLTLGNTVGGNVLAGSENITLTSGAAIEGNLTYYSNNKLTKQAGSTVSGQTKFHRTEMPEKRKSAGVAAGIFAFGALSFFWALINFLTSFLLGTALIRLFPRYVARIPETIKEKPWTSMLVGFAFIFLLPVVVIFLLMSVIGIPLAFLTVMAALLLMYIAKIYTAFYVGRLFFQSKESSPYHWLLVGLLIYYLLGMVPVFGGLITFLMTITGIGAHFAQMRAEYLTLKTKKLV